MSTIGCAADDSKIDLAGLPKTSTSTTNKANNPLQIYYKLDENSGSTATDSSGNSFTGTIGGGASWTTGKVGAAVNFPGAGNIDFALGSFYNPFPNQKFSIYGWLNLNSVAGTQTILLLGYLIKVDLLAGKLRLGFYNSSGTYTAAHTSTATLTTGVWTHFAITYNGGTKMYINGSLDSTNGGIFAVGPVNNWCSVRMNAVGADVNFCSTYLSYLNGKLDELYVYNIEKSASEVSAYYVSIP